MENARSKAFNWVVYATVFLSGAVTMSLEMLIGRSLTPYLGGTIYTWGALIAVFLIGMTMGYLIGGRLADRFRNLFYVAGLFVASAALVALVPLASDEVINTILDHVEDMRLAALLACLCFAFAPALVLAAVSPAGLQLVMSSNEKSGTVSGHISAMATLGSIFGTLLTSFYLIPTIGTHSIYFGLSGLTLLTGALLPLLGLTIGRQRPQVPTLVPIGLLVLAAVALTTAPRDAEAQQNAPFRLLKEGLIERTDSEYNTIFVERASNMLYMAFGYRRNRYIESMLDLDDLNSLAVVYTRYMSVAAAYVPNDITRIAMVGLGGGRTISYLVDTMTDVKADVAELDPSVIRLAKTYFNVRETDRLHIFDRDGRVFLAQTKEQYDMVLVDAYRGPFVPFHLTTAEFYRQAKAKLRPGGVVAQNVEPTTLLFDSNYATLKSVFNNVDAYEAQGNVVLVAYDGPALDNTELQARAAKLQAKYKFRYNVPELLRVRNTSVKVASAKPLTDDFAPVEMLKTIERYNQRKAE